MNSINIINDFPSALAYINHRSFDLGGELEFLWEQFNQEVAGKVPEGKIVSCLLTDHQCLLPMGTTEDMVYTFFFMFGHEDTKEVDIRKMVVINIPENHINEKLHFAPNVKH